MIVIILTLTPGYLNVYSVVQLLKRYLAFRSHSHTKRLFYLKNDSIILTKQKDDYWSSIAVINVFINIEIFFELITVYDLVRLLHYIFKFGSCMHMEC